MHLVMEKSIVYAPNEDELWKQIISQLFEEFLIFFLPEFHAQVDFEKPVEFLQQELFKEIIVERKGKRMADQIAKVYLKTGEEQWVLVHTEIQSRDDADFPLRMFEYYYKIFDRHQKEIVAIALFTDKSTKSSNRFERLYFGTELSYTFNKYVLSDFDEEQLKQSPKLFSKAILAALYLNKTGKNFSLRREYKRILLKEVLLKDDYSPEKRSALFFFVDYLLTLPHDMSEKLTVELSTQIREERSGMDLTQKETLSPTMRGILALERQEGRGEGLEESNLKLIKRLVNKGYNDEQIMDIADITIEQLQQYKEIL